jgi:hypothetical protein
MISKLLLISAYEMAKSNRLQAERQTFEDLAPVVQEVILYSIAKSLSLWPTQPAQLIEGSLSWNIAAGV